MNMGRRFFTALLYFVFLIFGAVSVQAATCTVNVLTDNGTGSGGAGGTGDLRYCITQTNANAGADTINITLTGTILLNSNLPYISGSLTINGSNQNFLIIDAQNGENRRGFEIDAPAGVVVTIRNMTIRNGNITSSGIGSGGGVSLISGAALSLESVNIINNKSVDGGAGIYVNGSNLNVQNSRITGNNSTLPGAGGGAINFFNGTLLMTGTNVSGNTASNGGAMAFAFVSLARIENSSITGNNGVRGGGIYNAVSALRMSNVTISGNRASELGGGFVNANDNGHVTLRNCTVAGNSATNSGGGFYNFGGTNITTTIANTIIADNSAINGADIFNSFSSILLREGANIIETEIIGGGGIGGGGSSSQVDPMLFPLDTNGSQITVSHNFAPNSPARNAGVNGEALNTLSAPLTTDQRGLGYSRVAGSSVDIGAYEFISSVVTKTADTNDGVCNADCSLREAVAAAIPGSNIEFSTLFDTPQTITLGSLISITKSLTLIGSGADKLTISGGNTTSLFENFTGFTASISFIGMTFADGNGTGGSNSNQGGAMEIHGTGAAFDRVVFRNNTANLGGALLCFAANCRITNSTFHNNSAPLAPVFYGGSGNTQIINTTISGNGASGSGYGAFYLRGNTIIRNSTITDNLGFSNLYLSSETVSVTMANTIVAGSATNDIYRTGGTVISNGGNLIGRNANAGTTFSSNGSPNANLDFVGTNVSPVNPLLAPLANYGGTTPTRALLPNSPALNNGINCVVNNSCSPALLFSLLTDQRGALRQSGTAVDIGAIESNISINPAALPGGNTGVEYNQQLSAVREISFAEISEKSFGLQNFAPTQFEIVPAAGQSLPPGITLSSSGLLSGIPTAVGTYTFTVKAVDLDTISGARTYVVQVFAPTAANVSVSGQILTSEGKGLIGAIVKLTDQNGAARTARSSSFGGFHFDQVEAGQTYIISVTSKYGQFTPRVVSVSEDVTDLVLTANE